MKQAADILQFQTRSRGLLEITSPIVDWVGKQTIKSGLLTLFCRHSSASLLIQENAAPEVRSDLETFFERLVPENPSLYDHNDEGPDDMPSHIRSALTQVNLSVPLIGGKLVLGTWQGIYLFEHRRHPHRREIAVHLQGE